MLLHETISIPGGPAEFVACCEKAVPQTNKLTPSKNSLATRIRDPFRSVKSGLKFSGLHVGDPLLKSCRIGLVGLAFRDRQIGDLQGLHLHPRR